MTATASADLCLDAFEAAADVYDAFTSHHDYEAWMSAIEPLARRQGLPSRGRLLDVGCGTGKSLLPWVRRGWEATGCDNSRGMLAGARGRVGAGARLVEADARRLPVLGTFELVLLIDDVVNYLAPDELRPAFAGAARNLAPGGLLVFDLNTLWTYRTFFAQSDVRDEPGRVLVWHGRAGGAFGPGDVADATLDVFQADDGVWRRRRGLHRQYHHPVGEIKRALADAGLALAAVHGPDFEANFAEGVDEDRHTKSIVIARLAEAPVPEGR